MKRVSCSVTAGDWYKGRGLRGLIVVQGGRPYGMRLTSVMRGLGVMGVLKDFVSMLCRFCEGCEGCEGY